MQPPRLVAVDSNILLALAEEDDEAIDAWEVVRNRIRPALIIVPPTVLREVGHQAEDPAHPEVQAVARKALRELRFPWMLQPVVLRSDQTDLAQLAREAVRRSGLLPSPKRNHAIIFADCAALPFLLLVSHRSHLCGLDRAHL